MLRDVRLVAGKDLRIERRSRVGLTQVLPFALAILVLFGMALDGDQPTLQRLTAGLYWVAVLLAAVLVIQRAFAVESTDGLRDALRLSGLDPRAIFLGKATAIVVQLVAVQVVLGLGVILLFGRSLDGWLLLVATAVVAAVGIAAAGSLYGVLAAGLKVKDTLLPILLLPVLTPVLIAATRSFGSALGDVAVDGWAWFNLVAIFAAIYLAFGLIAFGPLLEES